MPGSGRLDRRRVVFALLVVLVVGSFGVDVVVGAGDSMEPRYQSCDVLLVDTVRDWAGAVRVGDTIVYRSEAGLIVHEVVGVSFDDEWVMARGLNRDVRDRVTSEMLVGVVVAHLDTSGLCSRYS